MPEEEKLKHRYEIFERRYEILDKLIELLSHGEAKIKWADKVIIEIEDINTKAKVTK